MTPIGFTARLGATSCSTRMFFQHFRRVDGRYAVDFGCKVVFLSFIVGSAHATP